MNEKHYHCGRMIYLPYERVYKKKYISRAFKEKEIKTIYIIWDDKLGITHGMIVEINGRMESFCGDMYNEFYRCYRIKDDSLTTPGECV